MKKIIITAISAIAVIASVIGCQIYDSQTNANLYHYGVKLQDFADDFNANCVKIYDNSSDTAAYDGIVDAFWGFTEHFERKTAMVAVKAAVAAEQTTAIARETAGVTDEAIKTKIPNEIKESSNKNLHDSEWCKNKYKTSFMTKDRVYTFVVANKTEENIFTSGLLVSNGDGTAWSIAGLWEKTYKLKWDYNSKK